LRYKIAKCGGWADNAFSTAPPLLQDLAGPPTSRSFGLLRTFLTLELSSAYRTTITTMTVHLQQVANLSSSLDSAGAGGRGDLRKMLGVETVGAESSQICLRTKVVPRDPTKREHPFTKTHSNRIRSRLLNSLGIEKERAAYMAAAARANVEPSEAVQRGQDDAFHVVLKADYGKPDRRLESLRNSTDKVVVSTGPGDDEGDGGNSKMLVEGGNPVTDREVTFDVAVKVHPIPARSDYSQRMHAQLWTPQEELQQNAARNQFEFAAEAWDYRKVVDDEEMVLYGGEKVHPIHFMEEEELQKFFSGILEQQQQQEQQSS